MRRYVLCLFFAASSILYASDFDFPTGLQAQDIPIISQSFTSGFLTRTPVSLLGQDKYKTEIGLRVNDIDTGKVSKLGNGTKEEELRIQEFFFSKKLPLNVELGIHTSLSILDRDINTFGGYARWGVYTTPWGGLAIVGHGASGNYKNVLGTNLYGGMLSLDMNAWLLHMSVGTGFVRSTNTFDSSLFGTTGAQPAITYGKMYTHQSIKLSYLWNNVSFSGQGDWLKDFFSSAHIAYLF